MLDVEVIHYPQAAAAALDPVRARLLAELSKPASAAALAARLSLPRQKVNYHLRALESHHLVRPTSQRKWGGITERLVEATASSYVVSPAAIGPAASDPGRSRDRLSAAYLIALAARVVREVSELATRARETGKRLATLSIDTEIRFRSAAERAQFSSELTAAIAQLAARYHDASAPGGRSHRLVLVAHPLPQEKRRPQYERKKGTERTPFRAGGSRSTGHPGTGAAGNRHRSGRERMVVPTEVDGRIGGTETTHFGAGMDSVSTIT